jgi:predicted Rossmann fold flavoprotein
MTRADVIVVGAGAAGLMCAAVAGQRGRRVILLDHSARLAEKIRISGGGRCNFTNRQVSSDNFLSQDPHFCRTALNGYGVRDFLSLIKRYHIAYHEKHKGQLFCDRSSEDIIAMLKSECQLGRVDLRQPLAVHAVRQQGALFALDTDDGVLTATRLVVASGGLSIPKIGASDFGYRLARQFGITVIDPQPALVPLTFDAIDWRAFHGLAGIAAPVSIGCQHQPMRFEEDLLFTHRGISGPAVLQISSYWKPGSLLDIDLLPGIALGSELLAQKEHSRQALGTVLGSFLPKRLAGDWLSQQIEDGEVLAARKIAEIGNKTINAIASSLKAWQIRPSGSEGFKRAEVTRGGVATSALSAATLEAHAVPGLHFIGEVVDVTGWLGGYNFQWAWSSAFAAAQAL